jgi:hypothetical protein
VSWKLKRQPTVALSSAESEYMALAAATQEGIWCRAVCFLFLSFSDNSLFTIDAIVPVHLG